jgi:hypothetical protein
MNTATPSPVSARPDCAEWFVDRSAVFADTAPRWKNDVLALFGAEVEDWSRFCILRQTRVKAGTPICSEGAVTRALYVARCGAFKSFRLAEDGYEQIVDFAITPGEVLGFEGLVDNGYQPLGATALEDAGVRSLAASPRGAFCCARVAMTSPAFWRWRTRRSAETSPRWQHWAV